MTDFVVIKPVAITEGMLTSSSIPEPSTDDPPAWINPFAYVAGVQASRSVSGVHKVYQRLVDGNTPTPPENDPINWVFVGATNRWKMFDLANNTQSSAADVMVVDIYPNQFVDRLVILNADAKRITLSIAGTAYDATQGMESRFVGNWYEYFFTRVESGRREFVFEDIPLRLANVYKLTVDHPTKIARIGTVVMGLSQVLGTPHYGVSAGITDYSKKFVDDFGNASIVPRPYSKRMSSAITVLAKDVDGVHRYLTKNRSIPLVFIGAHNEYGALIVYGFFRSFEIVIAYYTHSICSLDTEGLI